MNRTTTRLDRFNASKRAIDLVITLAALPVLATIGAIVSIIIIVTMGRPIFFVQRRIGYREQEFEMLKFRTMNAIKDENGALLRDECRMTRAGRLLRRTSLDEIPQVLNILRGEMALVGPRPLLVRYLPHYKDQESLRHRVRPGVTGLAQVSGRNSLLWDQRLRYDAEYTEAASLVLDAKIVIQTVIKVAGRRDISVIAGESGEPLDVVRSYPSIQGYSLRRFEAVDIPLRVQWFLDGRIRAHMTLPNDLTVETTTRWLRDARSTPGRRDFVVQSSECARVVGMAGIKGCVDEDVPELYILVDPEQHGQGIGRISLALVLYWLQSQDQYRGCWLSVADENLPAIALYKAAGFEPFAHNEDDLRIRMSKVWQGVRP